MSPQLWEKLSHQ